ncbi:MAG: hypothetical protein ABJR23_10755, partial [Paracoccaceae bacterium]
MTSIASHSQSNNNQLPDDLCQQQVKQILSSPDFSASPRRRTLLQFLVGETLAGRGDQLKGYVIATEALGRSDDFDARTDPVVRIEARRLRRDLDSYYGTAGRDDPIHLSIPKGAYAVLFEKAEASVPTQDATSPETARSTELKFETPEEPEESPQTRPTRSSTRPKAKLGRIKWIVFFGMFVLLVGVFGWVNRTSVFGALNTPRIIVLPFEALDASDGSRLIARSLSHDLVSDMMRFPDFRMYSTLVSDSLGTDADPIKLGRELGVSYVVHGNVQSDAGTLRLGSQLSDASTGQVVWSHTFNVPLIPDNLLEVRSKLSAALATTLGEPYGVVNAAIANRLNIDGVPSMDSYSCVLRAGEYRRTFEDKLFAPALSCLGAVVVKEPDYADAWAMLGWLNLDAARQDMVPEAEHPIYLTAAHDAATRSLELDPSNQRGYQALAAIEFSNENYAEAERLQRAALALNPHDPEILAQLGWRLAVRGNMDEGVAFLEKAIARSANPPGWYFHLISVHNYMEGNYAAALAAAEHSAEVGSAVGLSLAAISHAKLGSTDAASASLTKMAEAWPLLGRDPAAAYGNFQVDDHIVATLVEGL